MLGRSFKVGSLFGVDIEIHPSWLVILGLLSLSLAEGVFPNQFEGWSTTTYWVVGVIAATLLFVTVLVHELAHAVVAMRNGIDVPKITLFIFGGVSHLGSQPRTAGVELAVASAGPLTSVALAVVAGVLALLLDGVNEQAQAIAGYLAVVNVLLAVFNILPGFPLDGGRVLRSIAWRITGDFQRATRVAAGVGEVVAYGMIAVGFLFMLSGNIFGGLWLVLIAWFLLTAARAEAMAVEQERLLGGVSASDVMNRDMVVVPGGMNVRQAVDSRLVPEGSRAALVADASQTEGILTVTDIRAMPQKEWEHTPVSDIMTPREELVTVTEDVPANEVVRLLREHDVEQIPVLRGGEVIGIVTRARIEARLRLAAEAASD